MKLSPDKVPVEARSGWLVQTPRLSRMSTGQTLARLVLRILRRFASDCCDSDGSRLKPVEISLTKYDAG